jgi:hypothetical protein
LPRVLLVTLKTTVQLPAAGILIAMKVRRVWPAVNDDGLVPVQVPVTAPPTALMLTKVSVNAPPFSGPELLLDILTVTTDVPPGEIVVGLNALETVGGANTESVAVLLGVPAVVVCVVVTPEVVLAWTPGALLVTVKMIVQLPPAGIVIPAKLRAVWPAVNADGVVPAQVPVTAPATALMFVRVSVNAPPVRSEALLFERVSVTPDIAPDRMVLGLNVLEMVGGVHTVKLAVLLADPVVAVWVVVTPDVAFGWTPCVALVTLKITVQLLLAGIVIPVKLSPV